MRYLLRLLFAYPNFNRLAVFAFFAAAPILGSGLSILFHIVALLFALAALRGQIPAHLGTDARRITIILFAFAGFAVADTLGRNGFSHAGDLAGLVTLMLFPTAVAALSLSAKLKIARAAAWGAAVACAGALVFALVQYYGFGLRPAGLAGNPIVFAMAVCLAAGLCLAAALTGTGPPKRYAWAAFACGTATVFLSQTRSAWVAFAAVCAAVLLVNRGRLRGRVSQSALGLGLAAVLLAAPFLIHPVEHRLDRFVHDWRALSLRDDYDTSVGIRVALWRIGLRLFGEHPLLGWGMGGNKEMIRTALERDFGIERSFSHFHNGILTLLVETGVVGAALFCAVFVLAGHAAWKAAAKGGEAERFGATMLWVCLVTYAVFGAVNLLRGHDIVDAMFMVYLTAGVQLAAGWATPMPRPGASPFDALMKARE